MVQSSQMLTPSVLPPHLDLPRGRTNLFSCRQRELGSSFKPRSTPWVQWAGPFAFSDGSCGYGNTLSLSSTATTDANKSDGNHRFFRTEKDLGLFKAERDLGPSVPPLPPGDEVTHTRTWGEQKEMTQCPGQVLSTWPGVFI